MSCWGYVGGGVGWLAIRDFMGGLEDWVIVSKQKKRGEQEDGMPHEKYYVVCVCVLHLYLMLNE